MSWDVAVFGDLKFPAGQLAKWRTLRADASTFNDWKGHFEHQTPASEVSEVLEGVEALAEEALCVVESDEDTWKLRAMMPKDPFLDWGPPLAAAFRAAAQVGAEGEVCFIGYETISLGYRVKVKARSSSFEQLDAAGIKAAEKTRGFREVDAMVKDAIGGE